ncbi:MAG: class I SAM-dependent methyltransferase [Candidatus Bathycorpusculaceae bacterium]
MSAWDEILHEEWYSRETPDDIVIQFATLLEKNKKVRVLDLGCGAGRHTIYMASKDYEIHGIDISATGLNLTKERLKRQGLEAYLAKCDMKTLPYMGSCFDAVISLHAIYHQKLEGIQKTISEIHRILRKNGLLLINFLSKRTYSYGKGVKVEENTFVMEEGPEEGVFHHFCDEEELKYLFRSFHIVNLELVEKEVEGKLQSRWVLIAAA